jgi:hypothetical protein
MTPGMMTSGPLHDQPSRRARAASAVAASPFSLRGATKSEPKRAGAAFYFEDEQGRRSQPTGSPKDDEARGSGWPGAPVASVGGRRHQHHDTYSDEQECSERHKV